MDKDAARTCVSRQVTSHRSIEERAANVGAEGLLERRRAPHLSKEEFTAPARRVTPPAAQLASVAAAPLVEDMESPSPAAMTTTLAATRLQATIRRRRAAQVAARRVQDKETAANKDEATRRVQSALRGKIGRDRMVAVQAVLKLQRSFRKRARGRLAQVAPYP